MPAVVGSCPMKSSAPSDCQSSIPSLKATTGVPWWTASSIAPRSASTSGIVSAIPWAWPATACWISVDSEGLPGFPDEL